MGKGELCRAALAFAFVSIFHSQWILAETIVSSGESETTAFDQFVQKLSLSYYGVYNGASLESPMNSLQPTEDGTLDNKSPQMLESLVTMNYRTGKDTLAGVNTHFFYFPFRNPDGQDQSFQMLDPALILTRNNVIDSKGLNLRLQLFTFLPVSSWDFLVPNKLALAISPTAVLNYDFSSIPLSIGFFSYIRGYIPTAGSPSDVRTYKLYFAPMAKYSISKTLSATLWVDLIQAAHNRGTGSLYSMQNATADIEPGLNWDITPNISFNPILNIYPSNPTLASTSIRALIYAKLF